MGCSFLNSSSLGGVLVLINEWASLKILFNIKPRLTLRWREHLNNKIFKYYSLFFFKIITISWPNGYLYDCNSAIHTHASSHDFCAQSAFWFVECILTSLLIHQRPQVAAPWQPQSTAFLNVHSILSNFLPSQRLLHVSGRSLPIYMGRAGRTLWSNTKYFHLTISLNEARQFFCHSFYILSRIYIAYSWPEVSSLLAPWLMFFSYFLL